MSHRSRPHVTPDGAWSVADRRDRLVELHVLAAHGDHDAARAARTWLATDVEARRDWDTVQRECEQIRAAADPPNRSAPSADQVRIRPIEEGTLS